MARKKDKSPQPDPKNTLKVDETSGKNREQIMAELYFSPILTNAATARTFGKGMVGDLDLTECVGALRKRADDVLGGNLGSAEETLTAQATVLNGIFNELARRAALNMGEYINAAETYMRLALKAQSQCRATLETLALIKNPQPVAFVRQANIAHGPQQVNNAAPSAPSRVGNSEIQPNKVLEDQRGERLDFGAARAARQADSSVETVGTVNRTENTSG